MNHDERMHELLYSNDGREEMCERICKLESLATEMAIVIGVYDLYSSSHDEEMLPALPIFADRLEELGIDVPSVGVEVPNV